MRIGLALVLLVLGTAPAWAGGAGDATVVVAGHLFGAGSNLRVMGGAEDDAFLAGGRVFAGGRYGQDLFAAGGEVTIAGEVARDLCDGAGTAAVERAVGDDLFVSAGSFRLREDASIAGDAFLSGGTLDLDGDIAGSLRAAGGSLTINGVVGGDVVVHVGMLILGPNARIRGSLAYSAGDDARIDAAAVVDGGVRRLPTPGRDDRRDDAALAAASWSLGAILGLMILAALLHWTFPAAVNDAADTMVEAGWRSFGIGLAVVVGLPLTGLVLIVSILGIPLGMLLWLVWIALAIAASVIAGYWLGLRGRSLFAASLDEPGLGARLGWTLAGFIGLGLIAWIPWVGNWIVGAIGVVALGALVITAWTRLRTPRPVSAAI